MPDSNHPESVALRSGHGQANMDSASMLKGGQPVPGKRGRKPYPTGDDQGSEGSQSGAGDGSQYDGN
jgi:hypothetical protein